MGITNCDTRSAPSIFTTPSKMEKNTISDELVVSKIYTIRGQKVMLDRDLAELYGVDTKRLKEAVRRNKERSPRTSCSR